MGARSSKNTTQNNRSDGHLLEYFRNTFIRGGGANASGVSVLQAGLSATGGIISDYTSGPVVYRAHIFTSSGTFQVNSLSQTPAPNSVDILMVGGGGGGGASVTDVAGGGGSGGFLEGSTPGGISVGSYPIVIGSGGVSGGSGNSTTAFSATASGGGNGAKSGGSTTQNPQTLPAPVGGGTLTGYGNVGHPSPATNVGGGGGGAGGAGGPTATDWEGTGASDDTCGGDGRPSSITGITTHFAGGGGGGVSSGRRCRGGIGGGGGGGGGPSDSKAGAPGFSKGINGVTNGSGGSGGYGSGAGGGGASDTTGFNGGLGGSGIVVVRYRIAEITATAKATGGVISYYNGKTIHTFTGSGSFSVTNGPLAIEYVAIGGGGGGGDSQGGAGGGGGAGSYLTGPATATNGSTYTITVGAGGLGASPPSFIQGDKGGDTSISGPGITVDAYGGGGGKRDAAPYAGPGAPTWPFTNFGSGGGGTVVQPAGPGGGYSGGASSPSSDGFAAGGGGGAGGNGTNGISNPPNAATAGPGGLGRQVPATFRNPSAIFGFPGPTGPVPANNPGGDTSGLFWFAGGGGGGVGEYQPAPPANLINGKGGGPGGPYAGAGDGGTAWAPFTPTPHTGTAGFANSGSGGGGGAYPGTTPNTYWGSAGGSGIVLIAYPS